MSKTEDELIQMRQRNNPNNEPTGPFTGSRRAFALYVFEKYAIN